MEDRIRIFLKDVLQGSEDGIRPKNKAEVEDEIDPLTPSIGHFDLGRDSDILGIGPPLLVKRAEFCQSNSSTYWLDDIMGCRWDIDQSCTKYITKLTLHITPKHMIRGECFSAIFRGEDPLTSPKYRQFLRRDISDNN